MQILTRIPGPFDPKHQTRTKACLDALSFYAPNDLKAQNSYDVIRNFEITLQHHVQIQYSEFKIPSLRLGPPSYPPSPVSKFTDSLIAPQSADYATYTRNGIESSERTTHQNFGNGDLQNTPKLPSSQIWDWLPGDSDTSIGTNTGGDLKHLNQLIDFELALPEAYLFGDNEYVDMNMVHQTPNWMC